MTNCTLCVRCLGGRGQVTTKFAARPDEVPRGRCQPKRAPPIAQTASWTTPKIGSFAFDQAVQRPIVTKK